MMKMNKLETNKMIKGPSNETIKECVDSYNAHNLVNLNIHVYDARPYYRGDVLRASCVIGGEPHAWEACITEEGQDVALNRAISTLVGIADMTASLGKHKGQEIK